MKRDRNRLITLLILLVILFIFAFLLKWAEISGAPDEGITTWREELWYLVVTLTTVGYGDLVPHSFWGRVIGSLFLVGSIGLFSWLVSLAISLISGDYIPRMKLKSLGRKKWYIFDGDNERGRLLADQLSEEDTDTVIIFSGSDAPGGHRFLKKGKHPFLLIPLSLEDCLFLRKDARDEVLVFLLGDDEWNNYLAAKEIAATGCKVCCRTSACPDRTPDGIKLFSDSSAIGRLYWQDFPLEPSEKEIVLIGGRVFGESVLEKGILNNVFGPDRYTVYHTFGDFDHFRDRHARLRSVMAIDEEGAEGDAIYFHTEPWEQYPDLIEHADRIILCADTDEENLALYWSLKTYYPVSGKIYIRLTGMVEEPGITVFGSNKEIYQPENVLNNTLVSLGVRVNELYRTRYGGSSWEELSEFHRQSSIASADHLSVKASILLGETLRGRLTQVDSRRAFEVYQLTKDRDFDLYRTIEHERWMRFHAVYNWRYAEKRNNAQRKHHLFIPYGELPEAEQIKDDDAWMLLGEYANGNL